MKYMPDAIATVAFIPTAADVYESKPWMEDDRQKFVDLGFQVKDYDIKNKDEKSIYSDLKHTDIVFVSGGNSFYLLYHVRYSGFDTSMERLLEEGTVYIGSSAGSIIAGPTIEPMLSLDNSEQAPKLGSFEGLNFVDFVVLPHYGKEKYKARYEAIMREWSSAVKLLPVDDNQAIIVDNAEYHLI